MIKNAVLTGDTPGLSTNRPSAHTHRHRLKDVLAVDPAHTLLLMSMSRAERPTVLVAAFTGWNDAASAASDAVRHLVDALPTLRVTSIDSDDFYDLQLTRPTQCTVTGRKNIVWPQTDFYQVRGDDLPVDLILSVGPEPSMHWKDFSRSFLRIAEDLEADRLIFLASMFDDVPYTRPMPVSVDDGDPVEVDEDTYTGPIGIPSVINLLAGQTGCSSETIWIGVPQYLGDLSANPQASLDLLGKVSEETHAGLPLEDLRKKARDWRAEADMLVRYNDSLAGYVHELEKQYDSRERKDLEKAVSSGTDHIAQEAEDFLRSFDDAHPTHHADDNQDGGKDHPGRDVRPDDDSNAR